MIPLAKSKRGGRRVRSPRWIWTSGPVGIGMIDKCHQSSIGEAVRGMTTPIVIECAAHDRRRVRATVVTSARRAGRKVQTRWVVMGLQVIPRG